MSKFKVGDRAAVVGTCTGKTFSGETGTIRYISCSGRLIVGVEFDKDISGHGGNGYFKGKKSHCWNVNENMIKTVSGSKTIVIYANGTTTTALLKDGKKVLKTALAKCNPADTYDFQTGAILAFDRLFENKVKEVKRQAEVGEYIRLIKNPTSTYKCCAHKGDIVKIIHFGCMPSIKSVERDGYTGFYPDEYVVLEGYKGGAKSEN